MADNSLTKVLFNGLMRAKSQTLNAVNSGGGWFGILREPFGGAFQANIAIDAPRRILAFSGVFSCATIISTDIAKMGINLTQEDSVGIHTKVKTNSPFLGVLKKPNHYQTWYKFIEQWILSKLLTGNTYALKLRDGRGIVTDLYILDSQRVTPLVADNGDVYYKLSKDCLSILPEPVTVPASEIIHDMMVSLWHPLVGVTPIYACGVSATMGNRITANSTAFFENMSRPSGSLTAPGNITDETATRLKATFEENFSNGKLGRLMVAGDGLAYQPMTINAIDAQLIEQLKWTIEDVARCFHVPMYKLGGPEPVRVSVESLNQTYYSDCLQGLIESVESLLDDGLSLPSGFHAEFDLDNLMRMDSATRLKTNGQAVRDGILAPNEARAVEDLQPVKGGDSVYMQQQNYSLEALAKRDALADPFAGSNKAPAEPSPAGGGQGGGANDATAANDAQATQQAAALAELIIKGLAEPAIA